VLVLDLRNFLGRQLQRLELLHLKAQEVDARCAICALAAQGLAPRLQLAQCVVNPAERIDLCAQAG